MRSRQARALAERGLVRLVLAYRDVPEFVLLGGLVPDLLCTNAARRHVGTADVDVQVDLEIQAGSSNAARLEQALTEAGFQPEAGRVWRWKHDSAPQMVVKVEFLADQEDIPDSADVRFDSCKALGARNLRGTGFAAKDWVLRTITAELEGNDLSIDLRVATLPAYLLAKVHAAHGRALEKDWYDIAYVLLHNDDGGPVEAATRVRERFGDSLAGATRTALVELLANFADANAQGSMAYATTMSILHPELDADVLANDAVAAVAAFISALEVVP